jgi:hypothetical protein
MTPDTFAKMYMKSIAGVVDVIITPTINVTTVITDGVDPELVFAAESALVEQYPGTVFDFHISKTSLETAK